MSKNTWKRFLSGIIKFIQKNESDLIFLDVKRDIDMFDIEWEFIADGFETEEMNEEFISFMKSKNNDRFDLENIYG